MHEATVGWSGHLTDGIWLESTNVTCSINFGNNEPNVQFYDVSTSILRYPGIWQSHSWHTATGKQSDYLHFLSMRVCECERGSDKWVRVGEKWCHMIFSVTQTMVEIQFHLINSSGAFVDGTRSSCLHQMRAIRANWKYFRCLRAQPKRFWEARYDARSILSRAWKRPGFVGLLQIARESYAKEWTKFAYKMRTNEIVWILPWLWLRRNMK